MLSQVRRISVAPMGLLVRFWHFDTWGRSCPRLYSVATLRLKNDFDSMAIRSGTRGLPF